jgi:predicted RNA-binding protein
MCESNVYMIGRDGKEKLCMESVDRIIPMDDGIVLENIFSETKKVRAKIKEMALVSHRIVLEEQGD